MSDWMTAPVAPNTNNLLGNLTPTQMQTIQSLLNAETPDTPADWMTAPLPKVTPSKPIAPTDTRQASGLTLGIDPSVFGAIAGGVRSSLPASGQDPNDVSHGPQGLQINPGPDADTLQTQADVALHPNYATAGKVLGTGLMGGLAGPEGSEALPQLLTNAAKGAGLAELSLGGAAAGNEIDPNNPLLSVAGGLLAPLSGVGLMSAASNVPKAFSTVSSAVKGLLGKGATELSPQQLDPLVGAYLNANAKEPASISGLPQVPGFSATPAAGADDIGLYPAQSALRSKGFGPMFEQRVGDNNAAITQGLREMAPKLNPVQTSTQAAQKLGALNQASKAVVQDEYAPFDAIKNSVNIPSSPLVKSVDDTLSGLSSTERDMIPQAQLDKIYQWGGVVPLNEVEGVRGALGDAAQLSGSNGARVINKIKGALDTGLDNVQTIHNADGTLMAPINGQAPLQMMQQARESNVWYRQKFPTKSPNNTPSQNFMARVVTGKIAPSTVLDTAMQTPENLGALLNASRSADGNPDPEIMSLAQNHYVNQLLDASSNRAGGIANGQLINGYAMRDFRNGNTSIEGMLFTDPAQRSALDDLQDAAIMNNKIIRSAVPGQSPTAQLLNTQDNMADWLHQGLTAGIEHLVPGGGMALKVLMKGKGEAAAAAKTQFEEQFRNRLAQALLDIPTYTKLRGMKVTPPNVNTAVSMLKQFPGKLKTSLTAISANPGVQAAVASGATQ